jgi:hypothetical protein
MQGQDTLLDDFGSSTLDDGQNQDMLSTSKRANSQSMSPDELKSILIDSERICIDRVEDMVKAANSLTRIYELAAFLKDEGISDPIKREVLRRKNNNGLTALFWAIRNRAHSSVIQRMVEIGGEALVLQQNPLGENSLHYAAYCGAELDVFKILLKSGGRKALLVKDKITNTPLHYACGWCEDIDTIKYLIEEGGKEGLLLENEDKHVPLVKSSLMVGPLRDVCQAVGGDEYIQCAALHSPTDLSMHDLIKLNMISEAERRLKGDKEELFQDGGTERRLNCLMVALWFYGNAAQSSRQELCDFIKHMARVGGRRLVTMKNSNDCNALHYAAFNDAPLEIVKVLVKTAGEDIIHDQNRWKNTPLHDACLRGAPEDVLTYLVKNQRGTEALLTLNDDENTPLDILFQAEATYDSRIAAIQRAWYEKDKSFINTISDDLSTSTLHWASRAVDATHVTSNKFVKTILNRLFIESRFRGVIMGDLYVQVIVVVLLSVLTSCDDLYEDEYTGECENLQWGGIVLLVSCLYLIAREAIQFSSTRIEEYVLSYENFLHIVQIVAITWGSVILLDVEAREYDGNSLRSILILATFGAWLKLLFILGQLNFSVSVFTSAVVQIVVELVPFALTSALVIAAFAQMFFIAGSNSKVCQEGTNVTKSDSFQCTVGGSYFQSFAMLLTTDFEFLDWESVVEDDEQGEGHTSQKFGKQQIAVSFMFAIIVGILLLNILIGVVSSVFDEVKSLSEDAFWKTRMSFMVEIFTIRNMLCFSSSSNDAHISGPKLSARASSRGIDIAKMKSEKQIIGRKSFAQYDDEWMMLKCPEEDKKIFFKWWYYSWMCKKDRPPLATRLWYYYKFASVGELLLPGDVFICILFGLKYDALVCDDRNRLHRGRALYGRIISYMHFVLGIILVVIIFVLGSVTFGQLWPLEFKRQLFFGPVESKRDRDEANAARGEELRRSKIENLEKQIKMTKKQNAEIKNQNADMKEQITEILGLLRSKTEFLDNYN